MRWLAPNAKTPVFVVPILHLVARLTAGGGLALIQRCRTLRRDAYYASAWPIGNAGSEWRERTANGVEPRAVDVFLDAVRLGLGACNGASVDGKRGIERRLQPRGLRIRPLAITGTAVEIACADIQQLRETLRPAPCIARLQELQYGGCFQLERAMNHAVVTRCE